MKTRKYLVGLFAFAALGTAFLAVAAFEEGKVVEIVETEMKFADCPVAIQKTIQVESVGSRLNEVSKVKEGEKSFYRAEVTINSVDYEILIAENGTLLGKLLIDDDETAEVNFADCPAPVQKTLKSEARGAEIKEVYEVTKNQRTEYVAVAKIEGKDYEIVVTDDGILISKLLDEDDEEIKKQVKEDAKET